MKALLVTLVSIASAGVLVAARPACAEAPARLLPAQSEIDFVSKQMGVPVDGRFKRFDARLAFDPKAPSAGHVTIQVDLASVDIGADAEAELAKPGWFDSKRNPMAVFDSTSIRRTAPGRLDVTGKLTIKGVARDALVPVTLTQSGGVTQASGAFVIKRLDYRIGDGEWDDPSLVANDVQVSFKLAFAGIAPLQGAP
ncbi:MAG TPA: YceI family protein [Burkholderiaceae bacterium]